MVSSACTTLNPTPQSGRDPAWVIERIETWRREKKWSANRIIAPSGHSNRKPGKIIARWPGHMAHLDVKKVGRIPDGGG